MQDKQQPSEELEHSIEEGHETRDLPVRGILIFGILLLLMLGIIFVVVTSIQFSVIGQPPPVRSPSEGLGNAPAPPTPPQPALLVVPGVDYQKFLAKEQETLGTYGWVDQKAGIVRIPIDRAMGLILQKGLPTRAPSAGPFQDEGLTSPSYSSSGRAPELFP